MARTIHVLVTNEGAYGWSAQSPQLRGFVYARPTRTEFDGGLQDALRVGGVHRGDRVLFHEQYRGDSPEGVEYIIRVARDDHRSERFEVAFGLAAVLGTEQRFDTLDDLPGVTGERVFICVVASDTIGWVVDQLEPARDACAIAIGVAGVAVASTQFATDGEGAPAWPTMAQLGWSRDTTMSEVLATAQLGTESRKVLALD